MPGLEVRRLPKSLQLIPSQARSGAGRTGAKASRPTRPFHMLQMHPPPLTRKPTLRRSHDGNYRPQPICASQSLCLRIVADSVDAASCNNEHWPSVKSPGTNRLILERPRAYDEVISVTERPLFHALFSPSIRATPTTSGPTSAILSSLESVTEMEKQIDCLELLPAPLLISRLPPKDTELYPP